MQEKGNNAGIFGFNREQVATAIAVLFHAIGLLGILYFDKNIFIKLTAVNLLLMFLLILYTQKNINSPFIIFLLVTIVIGIFIEIVGTKTGILFGNYKYGNVLGPSIYNVPFVIGLNWFVVIYCCGISMQAILNAMINKISAVAETSKPLLKTISVLVDGATLAVMFDWLMEPVAIKLGYWNWVGDGSIPVFNYACWFAISLLLLFLFHKLKFNKQNKFAVHLLLIQAMFFLLLRTLL